MTLPQALAFLLNSACLSLAKSSKYANFYSFII